MLVNELVILNDRLGVKIYQRRSPLQSIPLHLLNNRDVCQRNLSNQNIFIYKYFVALFLHLNSQGSYYCLGMPFC